MTGPDYQQQLSGLIKEFDDVLARRDELSVELVRILAAVRAIAGLPGGDRAKASRIRDMEERIWNPRPELRTGVEMTLRLAGKAMTPLEIKTELTARGYDLRKYSFSIAGIHHALKPLLKEGSVEHALDPLGRKAYRWKQS